MCRSMGAEGQLIELASSISDTHTLTHSRTHSHTDSLKHTLIHSLTHSPTHHECCLHSLTPRRHAPTPPAHAVTIRSRTAMHPTSSSLTPHLPLLSSLIPSPSTPLTVTVHSPSSLPTCLHPSPTHTCELTLRVAILSRYDR